MNSTIRRSDYLGLLHSGKDLTDIVKVITGMRRSGKSTLLRQYMDDLISSGVSSDNIIFINFETFEFRSIDDDEKLNGYLIDRISGDRTYIMLDEIQNVIGWERTVASLINTGTCDVYITGSNSRMLSSEMTTHISGRFIEISIQPLSFSEYIALHPGNEEMRFSEYLKYGALPEVDPSRGDIFCAAQLTGIYNTVLMNDILSRLGISDAVTLKNIVRFLYSNIGNITNVDMIAKELRIGNDTVKRYISKMEEAFLFYRAERFDIIGKRLLKTNGKYYASDLGLRMVSLMGTHSSDISRPLENIIYLELRRRGYDVRVGCYRDKEVDFTAVKDSRVEYYQISQTMAAEGTRKRELCSLAAISDNFPKTVLTMDRFGLGSEEGIEIVNVLDWLLGKEQTVVNRVPR